MLGAKAGDDFRQDSGGEGGQGRKPHDSAPHRRHIASLAHDGVEISQYALERGQEIAPDTGRGDASGIAVEQAHAQSLFEITDLNRQRGLRQMQEICGTGETAEMRHGGKSADLFDIGVHKGNL
jgi:hypothetical protein